MVAFVIAATIILGLAAAVSALLADRSREAQRFILLAGISTTLLLPFFREAARLAPMEAERLASSTFADASAHDLDASLLTIWLAGSALMLVRLLWHLILTVRLRQRSRVLDDGDTAQVSATLSVTSRLIARRFHISDDIDTPMVLAGITQSVLLPASWSQWPVDLKTSALRHEWQHVRGADAQWSVAAALLRVCLWFHPLAWWVGARWAEQCEHLADRAAASGRAAEDYAQELLTLADESRCDGLIFATAFISRSRSRLERRVRAILDESERGLPCGRVLRAITLLAFATVGITLAAALAPRVKGAAADEATDAQMRLLANPFPSDP